jgi:DNA replication and repair protein RecF
MLQHETQESYIEGTYRDTNEETMPTTVSIGFSRDKRIVLKKNNQKVLHIADFICQSAVVSFSSHDIVLIYGEPSDRRKCMDIFLCQTDAYYLENCISYKKNLLHRNYLLKNQQLSDGLIDIYEQKMVESGSYIWQKRYMFINYLTKTLSKSYNSIAPLESNEVAIEYIPYQSFEDNQDSIRAVFAQQLKQKRTRDAQIGYSTIGPHRDDFTCLLHNKPVKHFGSQGECRSMVLALRLSALAYIDEIRPDNLLVLVDDAFSELDAGRREQVSYLLQKKGQVFVTALSDQNVFFTHQQKFLVHDNRVSRA